MSQVVAATNRIDTLDPALLRSGRLDRKIEFPHPTEEARARILQIHSRKMNVHEGVNYEELGRSTDDFNGAQLKVMPLITRLITLHFNPLLSAPSITHLHHSPPSLSSITPIFHSISLPALRLQAVAVEAGMLALRRGGTELKHEDYVEGITVVQAKKKASLNYYA